MHRNLLAAAMAALAVGLVGCGSDGPDTPTAAPVADDDSGPAAGMCAPGVTDCDDTAPAADEFDSESERESARGMLGLAEDELAPDVRVARRGDELRALTEDYVLGRKTVELEADADGTYRVVSVLVELPDGPETFTTD